MIKNVWRFNNAGFQRAASPLAARVQPAELQGKKGWGQRGSGTTNGVSR